MCHFFSNTFSKSEICAIFLVMHFFKSEIGATSLVSHYTTEMFQTQLKMFLGFITKFTLYALFFVYNDTTSMYK